MARCCKVRPLRLCWLVLEPAGRNPPANTHDKRVTALPMKIDPYLAAILLVATIPTLAISLRSASGWRGGVVFAAFYPAIVVLVGILMIAGFLSLAAFGAIDLD